MEDGHSTIWKISFAYRLLNGMNECELCGNCYNYFLKTEDIKINSSRVDLYFINYYLIENLIRKWHTVIKTNSTINSVENQ